MKAQELRIGNWLHYSATELLKPHLINSDFQVSADDILFLSENPDVDYVIPIPLTEEWMVRLGLKDYTTSAIQTDDKQFGGCHSVSSKIKVSVSSICSASHELENSLSANISASPLI